MSFVTKQQCLKQPDTHFVISGYQDVASKEAVGSCLCPIGKKFDYENTQTCMTPSIEPSIAERWPLPLNNYSLETECRPGFEAVSVDDVNACVATTCPSGESLVTVNGIPRCVARGSKNDITYGYLKTTPCSRISAPLEIADQEEIRKRKYGGYYTFFPGKCQNPPSPMPIQNSTPEIWPIKYKDTKPTPAVMSAASEAPKATSFTSNWSDDQTIVVFVGAVGFLILLWLIVLMKWMRS